MVDSSSRVSQGQVVCVGNFSNVPIPNNLCRQGDTRDENCPAGYWREIEVGGEVWCKA